MNTTNKTSKTISKLALNIAIAGALMTTYGVRTAYAGTCTETAPPSGIWTCSGAAGADVTQSPTALAGGAMTIDTIGGFGITTAAGDAIQMLNAGADTDIEFSDNNNSAISGYDNGLFANNIGSGDTSITTTGAIIGINDDGISATNGTDANNLTIVANAASGFSDGIRASNNGSGDTTITTTGAITGINDDGIFASNSSTSGNLSVTVNNGSLITSEDQGLDFNNNGAGTSVIVVNGTINATGDEGIKFDDSNITGAATITVGATGIVTSGDDDAIEADADGVGDLTVTVDGQVIGDSDGLDLSKDGTGNIIVVAGVDSYIYGRFEGIETDITTTGGTTSITANGTIIVSDHGIEADNDADSGVITITTGAASSITAVEDGINADHDGTDALTITANGTITADEEGVETDSGTNSSAVTIITGNASSITAGIDGINAFHLGTDALTITINGAVSGDSNGISTTTDTANAGNVGITNITLNAGATVTGVVDAINNDGGASNVSVAAGAVVSGNIILNDGSDTLAFNGADISGVTLFDGGDDIDIADGFIDVLTFAGSSGALTGATVINWEEIIIDTGTISFTDAMLTTGSLTVTNGGTLDNIANLVLTGDLINNSTITMQDGDATDSTTVSANFSGGGQLNLDTVLGDETSASDTLVVTGDSSGNTVINITNAGGTGALTAGDGILVVQVDGNSAGTFTLMGTPAAGAFDYSLMQVGSNWYLQSQEATRLPPLAIPTLASWSQMLLALLLGGFAWFKFPRTRAGRQAS